MSGQGVAFVSLTDGGRQETEAFAAAVGAVWPHGYGLLPEAVARLGTASPLAVRSTPVRSVVPTLYLVGPDGRVLWTDGQARPRHRLPPGEVVRELEEATRQALAADPSPNPAAQ